MPDDMHVLILPSWYPTRACPIRGIFLQQQALALRRAGIKVGVIYPDFRSFREFKISALADNYFQICLRVDEGIPTYYYHGWNIPRLQLEPYLWKRQTNRLFNCYVSKYGYPDLIHAHSILWGGVSAMEIAQNENIPYIITEHASNYVQGMIRSWQKPFIRRAVNNADILLAVSKYLANQLLPYCDRTIIEVVPNMVDTDFFIPPPAPRQIRPFRFLTVARLTPKKGIDLLIKAFARAFPSEQDIFLDIGGDGEQRTELESLVKKLKLDGRVSFLGGLSREQVRKAMWRANVFILPSYVETFGVALIEAMSTGLFVIATCCGGPEEFIIPDTGWLVEPGDILELSIAIKKIYNNRLALDKREPSIRNYIVSKFSDKAVLEKILRYYNRAIR